MVENHCPVFCSPGTRSLLPAPVDSVAVVHVSSVLEAVIVVDVCRRLLFAYLVHTGYVPDVLL